jgi:transporter family protein
MSLAHIEWLLFSLITLFLWGLWGFFSKLATIYLNPKSVYLYGSIGAFMVTLFSYLFLGFKLDFKPVGAFYSIIAGLLGGAGVIFFYFAMKTGKSVVVVTLTALYPLITLLFSYLLLKEQITIQQLFGIFFALIAIVLLST